MKIDATGSMNIIIAINKDYIEPAKTMLFSLYYNNINAKKIVVYLMYSRLSISELSDLKRFVEKECMGRLIDIYVSEKLFQNAPKQKWWTVEMYYRLLAFDMLPIIVERALWLDSDIIVNGDILEFYQQDMEGKYAVACKGCNQSGVERLGLKKDHVYFNSGVILFNFNEIRSSITIEKIYDCIKKYKTQLQAPDQDVLNILFTDKIKYANPMIYNHETFGSYVLGREKLKILHEETKIIHFNGPVKPWDPKGANSADDIWWHYESMRGRRKERFCYFIQHLPYKIYYNMREIFYIIWAQVKTVLKSE